MVDLETTIEELRGGIIEFIQDEEHQPMTTEGELVLILESLKGKEKDGPVDFICKSVLEEFSNCLNHEISTRQDPICFTFMARMYQKGAMADEDLTELKGYYSGLKVAREMLIRVMSRYIEHIHDGVIADTGFEEFANSIMGGEFEDEEDHEGDADN